jgi:endonuclease YncB( thermonuclease family)
MALMALLAVQSFADTAEATELLTPAPRHPADQNTFSSESCEHSADAFHCVQYLYNHDGDTITVRIQDVHPLIGEKIAVRIAGIDTPEMHSSDSCERSAAKRAQVLVAATLKKAERIDLLALQRDKYFRILADVRADGESLAEVLLLNGLAYVYNGGTKKKINWCEAAVGEH